jgi:hypothetical protein
LEGNGVTVPRLGGLFQFGRASAPVLVGHAATSNFESFNLMKFMSVSTSELASIYTAAQGGA